MTGLKWGPVAVDVASYASLIKIQTSLSESMVPHVCVLKSAKLFLDVSRRL